MSSYFVNPTFPGSLPSGQDSFLGQLPLYPAGYDALRPFPASYGASSLPDKTYTSPCFYQQSNSVLACNRASYEYGASCFYSDKGAARVLVSKRARGACVAWPSAGRPSPPPMPLGCIYDLLSSYRTQEANYGGTRHCRNMLSLAPSFYSWRSKQDPNSSTHGSLAPKQLPRLRGAWAHSLGSPRILRLGAGLARGKGPGGEDSPGWILKANKIAN